MIYTGSGPRLGQVITLRLVLALACLRRIALNIPYASFLQWVPSPALYSPGAERCCLCLFGYNVRVLSYASGAFPCIVCVGVSVLHVALLRVLLGDWAIGLVTKAYLPAVWSMGGS